MIEMNPGGWREITVSEYMHERHLGRPTLVAEDGAPLSTDFHKKFWVLVEAEPEPEPVPPLPTAPHTVIRVAWDDRHRSWSTDLRLGADGMWVGVVSVIDPVDVARWIVGWEVLAEPRAMTEIAVREEVFAACQAELLADPYENWTGEMSKKQRHYAKAFLASRADALNIIHRHTVSRSFE